jgi:hypothetical protein
MLPGITIELSAKNVKPDLGKCSFKRKKNNTFIKWFSENKWDLPCESPLNSDITLDAIY